MRIIISLIIYLSIVPLMVASYPVVAMLLLTSWSGYTTPFGNYEWGRGNNHHTYPTKTYLDELLWLCWRNPVNNVFRALACWHSPDLIKVKGNTDIGDKKRGGSYLITMGWCWEIYIIKPYTLFGKRCIRLRAGWKINGGNGFCDFVFAFNPWKEYRGA